MLVVAEDKPIERSEIVKGYEVSKGEYVVIDEEDLKKIAPPTASTMDVLQFVKADEVDPIYFEHSYYVAADEKVSKPYSLFWQALKETSHWAIAKLSMHGRENIVLLRSTDDGLVLHTLFYPNESPRVEPPGRPEKRQLEKRVGPGKKPGAAHGRAIQAPGVARRISRKRGKNDRAKAEGSKGKTNPAAQAREGSGPDGSPKAKSQSLESRKAESRQNPESSLVRSGRR